MSESVRIELSPDEALVLSEFLARLGEKELPGLFEDPAEQDVLWTLEAALERTLVEILRPDYAELGTAGRNRLRHE